LLGKMQKEQAQIVMVIDERGTIVGLVTIEDLVEELVGEILSENDQPVSEPVREQDGSWVLSASLPIHEVNRLLPVDLPEGPFATLAGLCLHLAGSIPKVGTTLRAPDGISLEILETTSHRIRRVRLRRGITEKRDEDLG
jgi:putative hemolysin